MLTYSLLDVSMLQLHKASTDRSNVTLLAGERHPTSSLLLTSVEAMFSFLFLNINKHRIYVPDTSVPGRYQCPRSTRRRTDDP